MKASWPGGELARFLTEFPRLRHAEAWSSSARLLPPPPPDLPPYELCPGMPRQERERTWLAALDSGLLLKDGAAGAFAGADGVVRRRREEEGSRAEKEAERKGRGNIRHN